jgi:hypothetical protein
MNPRETEVHIEELVLHGFAPGDRWRIGDAFEQELRGLLAAKGIPATWLSGSEWIDAGTVRIAGLTKPARTGAQIASAVYRGGAK